MQSRCANGSPSSEPRPGSARMRLAVVATLAGLALCTGGCGSSKPETPFKVSTFDSRASCSAARSTRRWSRRAAAARAGRCSSSCTATAGRRATRSAPCSSRRCAGWATARRSSCSRRATSAGGTTGRGQVGLVRAREVIPAALRRSGADRDRVAIGGISMGGFGALDLGRQQGRSAPSAAIRRPSSSAVTTTSPSGSTTPPTSRATT